MYTLANVKIRDPEELSPVIFKIQNFIFFNKNNILKIASDITSDFIISTFVLCVPQKRT